VIAGVPASSVPLPGPDPAGKRSEAVPDDVARKASPPGVAARETDAPSLLDRAVAALPLSALVVVVAFAFRRLDDFDTWWHLASGRWIVQHLSIPDADVLSFTVPQNEWINLQWLYDVAIYGVWAIGGANGLVVASTLCFLLTFVLLARYIGRHVGPIPTTLLLLWVATTVNERFVIRPEMASFPLLVAVQLVLAKGRENPRRLRWLVPLMMLWANMHSLFILGVAAVGCAIAGALVAQLPLLPPLWRRDSSWPAPARRALMIWGGASIAATLVNPYFLRALLFPFELMTRINGSSPVYSAVGEFSPPFSGYFPTFAIGSYQAFVFTFAGVAVVAALLRAFERQEPRAAAGEARQGFDIGALVFAAALAYLSLLARRNIGIFAVGAAPLVAACVGILLARVPSSWTPAPVVRALSVAVLAGAIAICSMVVTNRWYAATGETHAFGSGVFEANFQTRAVEFFREQELPGPAFNDMTAGGYLTWDEPTGSGVYIDGRLEVYDTPFFGAYLDSLSNLQAWSKDADARGIQSVMLFHRWGNRQGFIRALMTLPEWRLVYCDEVVVTFVRFTGHAEVISKAREAFTNTWRSKTDAAMNARRNTWPWQWDIERYVAQLSYARLLEVLGEQQQAVDLFEKAVAMGLPPTHEVETRQRVARYHAAGGKLAQARMHLEKAAEIDPDNQTTQDLLKKVNEHSQ